MFLLLNLFALIFLVAYETPLSEYRPLITSQGAAQPRGSLIPYYTGQFKGCASRWCLSATRRRHSGI